MNAVCAKSIRAQGLTKQEISRYAIAYKSNVHSESELVLEFHSMANLIARRKKQEVEKKLSVHPAVIILGQRQVGKTTLAKKIMTEKKDAHYLNLYEPKTLQQIKKDGLRQCVESPGKHLTVLDEVQVYPDLFGQLLPIIDDRRDAGKGEGNFLLMGSASLELANRSKETLTGRIGYVELDPIDVTEIASSDEIEKLWLRGGLPGPFTATNDEKSFIILNSLVENLSRRELIEQGMHIARDKLLDLLAMLAETHGGKMNKSEIARGLDLSRQAVSNCISLLSNLLVIRELPAYRKAGVKNLQTAPKIYYRDSGLLHELLKLPNMKKLGKYHRKGESWEGFAIENILRQIDSRVKRGYLRTKSGKSEVDLVLEFPSGSVWMIEIKKGSTSVQDGFYKVRNSIEPDRCFVVHGKLNERRRKNKEGVDIISLPDMCREVAAEARKPSGSNGGSTLPDAKQG